MDDVLGLKKASASEIEAERDRRMRSLYVDPIEHFPEKVDRLLLVLNDVCI